MMLQPEECEMKKKKYFEAKTKSKHASRTFFDAN